ncbi:D-arabinose 5-phosphate isomerase [hydrothermal vent metagenome]|uniref:D-arabinose 5-phosphate isomerase n=1 Tax=hydrothermal vent metagenome TaxID=652676 RepID=A0A3B1DB47_9ZZZZ
MPIAPKHTPDSCTPPAACDELAYARRVFRAEVAAIDATADQLGDSFCQAVSLLVACAEAGGTVLVTGLGKSGLIGAKLSATLASLGIPSHAVHPTEAAHGDLGRFRPTDTVICLSRSGETDEVVNLAAILRQDKLPIISITGGSPADDRTPPSLERLATVALHLGDFAEAGEGPEAPTASTTAALALGDALALAAARRRNFTNADFAQRHPGGTLGGLLRPITECLRSRTNGSCPAVPETTPIIEAIDAAKGRRAGAVLLVDSEGRLTGIFTDADLRRQLTERGPGEWMREPIATVMTRSPTTLPETSLVRDAVRLTRERRLDEIPIVDAQGKPVGILDVQDLIAMRLVKDEPHTNPGAHQ